MICLPPQNQLCECWQRILLSSDVYKDLLRFNFVIICLNKCNQDSRDTNLSRHRHICAQDDCQEPVLPWQVEWRYWWEALEYTVQSPATYYSGIESRENHYLCLIVKWWIKKLVVSQSRRDTTYLSRFRASNPLNWSRLGWILVNKHGATFVST